MNPAVKVMWLTALRSGKYLQGFNQLKQIHHGAPIPMYCCLGVLYEIAVAVGIAQEVEAQPFDDYTQCRFKNGDGYPEPHWLTPEMRDWTGLDYDAMKDLSNKNDFQKMTFAQIADCIEENL